MTNILLSILLIGHSGGNTVIDLTVTVPNNNNLYLEYSPDLIHWTIIEPAPHSMTIHHFTLPFPKAFFMVREES